MKSVVEEIMNICRMSNISFEIQGKLVGLMHNEYIRGYKDAMKNIEQKNDSFFCICGTRVQKEGEYCIKCTFTMYDDPLEIRGCDDCNHNPNNCNCI